ncbi:MAG: Rieske (2Fe-2S) protein, partial [Gemmatimonadota bacterium]|nr:Rieske (2Fe-2S) protein [Gemmatimonadota bacterium]
TVLLGGCGGLHYVAARTEGSRLEIEVAELEPGGAGYVAAPGLDRPIYVHRTARGSYAAFLAECTHRRCIPEPAGERLVCPCHGSEFTLAGQVLEGPAERDLPTFRVEAQGPLLIIETGGLG